MNEHIDTRLAKLSKIESAINKMDEKIRELDASQKQKCPFDDQRRLAIEMIELMIEAMVSPFGISSFAAIKTVFNEKAKKEMVEQTKENMQSLLDDLFPNIIH